MPLRDHFQPPLSLHRPWESFHTRWAVSIADQLNERLPRRFFAEVQVHLGSKVEGDVVEFDSLDESLDESEVAPGEDGGGGVAVAVWAPAVATLTMPAVFPDSMEVHVRDELFDARVVAVVELVSPGNKDRPENRLAFAAKSAAYLQRGIGLVTVDIVTDRHFNLHNELVPLLGLNSTYAMDEETTLYAIAYRPIRRGEANLIEAWPVALLVGGLLPLLPLSLKRFRPVPLDLEAAYEDACRRGRL
ncbi:MAG TPA: DUF4058 family protein [Isosphaeraceae bacterium]|nr:DUF4058 family protein [Isosphaeraceae bacterium]